jgi:hypothetical protein
MAGVGASQQIAFKVVATQTGYYNGCEREPGEVFELLLNEDGSYPPKIVPVPNSDENGNRLPGVKRVRIQMKDCWDRPVTTKDGKAIAEHDDFAEDIGNSPVVDGPAAGEILRLGWMRRVPASVPLGFYPAEFDFWQPNVQLPPVLHRILGQEDRRAAPVLKYRDEKRKREPPPATVQIVPMVP